MLTDVVIDEDIEALLYAQIYHGKSDDPKVSCPAVTVDLDHGATPSEGQQNGSGGFEEQGRNDAELAINSEVEASHVDQPDSVTLPIPVTNRDLHLPSSESYSAGDILLQELPPASLDVVNTNLQTDVPNHVVRNPTVNQYITPSKHFWHRLKHFKNIWSNQCASDLKRLQAGKLSEKNFFRKLKTRETRIKFQLIKQQSKEKRQEQIRSHVFRQQQRLARSEVICLFSDSDSSVVEIVECESVVNNDSAENQHLMASSSASKPPEAQLEEDNDDDEIVYIEPPPVPFINLEDDDEDERPEIIPQDKPSQEFEDCSNDFLVPAATSSEQFNFSLHDADFQNVEFVRPAQPTDIYETESSTSTSEMARDFNNSVKTIVFNEIDFPKDDLFEGGNMDKFGELIDPAMADVGQAQNADKIVKIPSQRASSSSSESDYETVGTHRNLPHLSPMQVTGKRSVPTQKYKAYTDQNKSASEEEANLVISSEAPAKKLKKRSSLISLDVADATIKKVKKRKNKAAKDTEETQSKESSPCKMQAKRTSSDTPKKAKRKKKQRRSDSQFEIGPELSSNSEDTVKKKSKKRREGVANLDSSSPNHLIESLLRTERNMLDACRKKKGSKKQRLSSRTTDCLGQSAPEVPDENFTLKDSTSKKQRLSSGSKTVPDGEEHSEVLDENATLEGTEVAEAVVGENGISTSTGAKDHESEEEEEHSIDVNNLSTEEDEKLESEQLDDGDDVIFIEKDISIHTIESSDSDVESESGCVLTAPDELHLANVDLITDKLPQIMNDSSYDIENIQSKMSDDPEKWKILPVDRQMIRVANSGPRCKRCRERGHITKYCPNKSNIPSCSLCGLQGHQEPRCPNKICLNCGRGNSYTTTSCPKCANQKNYGICHVCKLPGHVGNSCPDLWRRYYLTTKAGPIVKPETPNVKPPEQQWCSGCAGNGHLEFQCNSYKWIREYPMATPFICSFKDLSSNQGPKKAFAPETSVRKSVRMGLIDKSKNTIRNSHSEVLKSNSEPEPDDKQRPPRPNTYLTLESDVRRYSPPNVNQSCSTESATSSQSPSKSPIFTKELRARCRARELAHLGCKPRLNPLSLMQDQDFSSKATQYTPYQSVLNPCSVLGASSQSHSSMANAPFSLDVDPLPKSMQRQMPPPLLSTIPVRTTYGIMDQSFQDSDLNHSSANRQEQYGHDNNLQITANPTISFLDSTPQDYMDYADFTLDNRYFDYSPTSNTNSCVAFGQTIYQYNHGQSPVVVPGCEDMNSVVLVDIFKKQYNVEATAAEIFGRSSIGDLKDFISTEIQRLDKLNVYDGSVYRKMLVNIEELRKCDLQSDSVRDQVYPLYKNLNMFLFGVHKLNQGVRNLNFLRNFVYNTGRCLQDKKRRALVEAYEYIFGGEHPNFNYRKCLNSILFGQDRDKRRPFL